MGTTTHRNLPYPEPTDRARNGSVAIRALAEAVDGDLDWSGGLTIAPGGSAAAAPGPVDFPGAELVLGDFVRTGAGFTYNGPARFFVVYVSVEVDNGGTDLTSIESSVSLSVNGGSIAATYDHVTSFDNVDNRGTLQRRTVVHSMTVPVVVSPGDVIGVSCAATPAGQINTTAIRIYPVGPK